MRSGDVLTIQRPVGFNANDESRVPLGPRPLTRIIGNRTSNTSLTGTARSGSAIVSF